MIYSRRPTVTRCHRLSTTKTYREQAKTVTIVCTMQELAEILSGLGMSQYLGSFMEEGFDSWDTILDITESDLYVPTIRTTTVPPREIRRV